MSQIIAKLDELIKVTKQTGLGDKRLWTIADIAVYLAVSEATVSRKFIGQPWWPEKIAIPNTHPRYKASEVIAAIEKFQTNNKRKR